MPTDESLIPQVKKLFEEKTGWGDSTQWSNQDFLELSELIRDRTGVTLSHVTLKRIWGKVKYESLPNTHTLNTLVQFLGYENWRDFSVWHSSPETMAPGRSEPLLMSSESPPGAPFTASSPQSESQLGPQSEGQSPIPSEGQPGTQSKGQFQTPSESQSKNQSRIPSEGQSESQSRIPSEGQSRTQFEGQSKNQSRTPSEGQSGTQSKDRFRTQPEGQFKRQSEDTSQGQPGNQPDPVTRREGRMRKAAWLSIPLALILLILLYLHGQQPSPQAQDYAFSSKKVVTSGLPNSVIFDYDASRSPDDSVVIQQSWDTTRRVKVPKNAHQYTSIYYYPDFYHATLQVGNKVVKTHNLLIKTDGWLPLIAQNPVPVYFRAAEAISNGKMRLTTDQIKQKNVLLQPSPPTTMFYNVKDFGEIYSDHFVFETALKNDYAEGSAACQLSRIYLLCEGTAIWVPLSAKGCVSTVDMFFTYFFTSGRREDLSKFGVDFDKYVKLRIESDSGRAKILIDDKLVYTVPRHIIRSKIIGIMYAFQGTGSVDYVSLSNGKVSYRDDF